MVYCRNWSREVGDCGNTWVPGQVRSQNQAFRARFWLMTGSALVLPQSLTFSDQFPLYHKACKHVFWQDLWLKWKSKLSGCCNILDGATIRTSYSYRISYCWKRVHVWHSHCWGRRLFSRITFPLNNGSVTNTHASNNSKSYCSMKFWLLQNPKCFNRQLMLSLV